MHFYDSDDDVSMCDSEWDEFPGDGSTYKQVTNKNFAFLEDLEFPDPAFLPHNPATW